MKPTMNFYCWSLTLELKLHGELSGCADGLGFGFSGQVEDEAFEDEELVGGAGAQFKVGAGDEA